MGMMNNMGDEEGIESDLESEMDEEEEDKKLKWSKRLKKN